MNIDKLWEEYWEAKELPDEMFIAPEWLYDARCVVKKCKE